jgi:ABC-type nitrate/sulfonate/bicarbonate transport system substrate-binding protein
MDTRTWEWIQKNPAAAEEFIRALVEASELINRDRKQAARMVSNFFKNLDPALVETLMGKLRYDVRLDQAGIDFLKSAEAKIKAQGKLAKPVDYRSFIYPDLLKKVRPDKVHYKL